MKQSNHVSKSKLPSVSFSQKPRSRLPSTSHKSGKESRRKRTKSKAETALQKNRERYQHLFLDPEISLIEVLKDNHAYQQGQDTSLLRSRKHWEGLSDTYSDIVKKGRTEAKTALFKRIEDTLSKTKKKYYGVDRSIPHYLDEDVRSHSIGAMPSATKRTIRKLDPVVRTITPS